MAIHFLHVGKTGGSAVKHALAPMAGRLGVVLHRHGTRLADLPRGERAFFFLRDPVERFVSGFHSRRRRGRPRVDVPWSEAERAAFERFESPGALAEAIGTDPAAGDAMRGIRHVCWPQARWTGPPEALLARRADVLMAGRCETLERDVARLSDLLGLDEPLRLPRGDVEAHRNPPGLDRHLSEPARAALRDWYARDYAVLEAARSL